MHIKFINTGKGSALSAKEYLFREYDSKGEIRESIQILRGNPNQVTAVAESLDFKHTYRSAVIAWHKDDQPTHKQVQEVLDEFERVAFAGLEPNQYTYYAVWHGESNGSGHIHIITPRVELQTGKSMNIAPPGWQSTYDLIVDKYNTKYEWASPKEISRQKTMTIDKIQIHADIPSNTAKKMIHKVINELVERGIIQNNSDVRTKLAEFGEITREGKDYISLKPNGFKKAIRLKGAYYEREFSVERVSEKVRAEQRERDQASADDRKREVKRIERSLERTVEKRAEYNRGRYDYKALQLRREIEQSQIKDRPGRERVFERNPKFENGIRKRSENHQANPIKHQNEAVDHTVNNWNLDRSRVGSGDKGSRSIRNAPTSSDRGKQKDHSRIGATDKRSEQNQEQVHNESLEQCDRSEERAESLVGQIGNGALDCGIREIGEIDDRVRKRVKSNLADTRADVFQRAQERNKDLRKTFSRYNNSIQQANERSIGSDRTAEQHSIDARSVIGTIQERVKRDQDQFGSRAIGQIKKSAQQFAQSIGRIGEFRQQIGGAVKRCIERALEKVREIQVQRSRSRGPTMMR